MIPVVKGWCTENAIDIASLGVQIHGGMGFIEETGAAQYLRDARIISMGGRKVSAFRDGHSTCRVTKEVVYGHQEGDGKRSTVDIVSGPGFDGARWWGANVVLTYQQRKDLSFSVRAEHFGDPDGFTLFPSSTSRGAFNALTAGLRYDFNKYLSLRPELRYDWFDGRDDARPFGQGDARHELTGTGCDHDRCHKDCRVREPRTSHSATQVAVRGSCLRHSETRW
ncbi:hypothetical protein D3C77_209070 [compost metagenome]